MTALERIRAYVRASTRAQRQITWDAAFAVSRPPLRSIRDWYDDCPPELKKAEAVEWLAQKALDGLPTDDKVFLERYANNTGA